MRRVAIFLLFALLSSSFLYAQEPAPAAEDEFSQNIKRLIIKSGGDKLGEQMGQAVLGQLKPMAPELPEEFWERAAELLKADEIIDLIIPIYKKHFTPEDIDALLAFFDTPIGQKLVDVQPMIMKESMQVGQKWGYEKGQQIMQQIIEQQEAEETSAHSNEDGP